MIIECESCGTRFNLADGQVPEQGARVRCSKCHHRFHVMPPSADPPPRPAAVPTGEDSMPGLPADDTPSPLLRSQPAEPPPSEPEPEPEPEMAEPEMAEPEMVEPEMAEPEPEAAGPEPAAAQSRPEPQATPADDPDLENPEFLFDDEPASEGSLDTGYELGAPGLDDELSAPDPELDSEPLVSDQDDAEHVRAQVFGIERNGATSDLGADLDDSPLEVDASDALLEADAAEETLDSADGIGEAEDDDDWASVLGKHDEQQEPLKAKVPEKDVATPRQELRAPRGPAEADLGSATQRAAQTALRTTALAIGLLLVLGGLRVLVSHGLGAAPGPEVVRANGWMATDLEAVQLRDDFGTRVLVLRGSLIPEEQRDPPALELTLLDGLGQPVESRALSHLERLGSAELAPRALTAWLQSGRPPRIALGPVTGFTMVVPAPPEQARRFRLDLLPAGSS